MTDAAGKRPGGLTALAVLNFVGGGLSTLGTLGLAFLFVALNSDAVANSKELAADEGFAEAMKVWREIGQVVLGTMVALSAVSAFTLIASGVGYLKQHRFWGRAMGNIYAIVSIGSSLAFALAFKEPVGGFNMMTLVNIVYPLLTVALLNTTFKEDFVR